MSETLKSALVRAIRTFVQTLIGTLAALLSAGAGEIVDLSTAQALLYSAGSAAIAAALAAAWRAILDPSPIPSLQDPAPRG